MKHEPGFYLTPRAIRYLRAHSPRPATGAFPYRHRTLAQLPNLGRPQ